MFNLTPAAFRQMLNATQETCEAYQTDLAQDIYWLQNTCTEQHIIWAVRKHGTNTFLAIESGINACEYYASNDKTARFFVLISGAEELQEVTAAQALEQLIKWNKEEE